MEDKIKLDNERRIAEEYLSSLTDLNCNSKPLINMLTILAEENIEFAHVIVMVVEQHIAKVSPDMKLPILYLIDSIVKNVKSSYVNLFCHCIVNIFSGVFEKVNEKIREKMYGLRQTWNEVFPQHKLYALDISIHELDNQWPITAKPCSIHVNPNFIKGVYNVNNAPPAAVSADVTKALELRKRELELELEVTNKHLEEVMPVAQTLVSDTLGTMPAAIVAGGKPLQSHLSPDAALLSQQRKFELNFHHAEQIDQMGLPNQSFIHANVGKNKMQSLPPKLFRPAHQRDPRLQRQAATKSTINASTEENSKRCHNALTTDEFKEKTFVSDVTTISSSNSSSSRNIRNNESSGSRKFSQKRNSKSRSTGRSRRSSSRDKDRTTQRLESKNWDKRRTNFSSPTKNSRSSDSNKHKTECDKDAFEIGPLSSSTTDKSVPRKARNDSKRTSRASSSSQSSKHHSPSSSTEAEPLKELRKPSPLATAVVHAKPLQFADSAKKDVKEANTAIAIANKTKDLDQNISSKMNTSPSNANICAQQSETALNNGSFNDTRNESQIKKTNTFAKIGNLQLRHGKSDEENEPATKKSKQISQQIDSLFGSKDVDMRPVLGGPFIKPTTDSFTPLSLFSNADSAKQMDTAPANVSPPNLENVRAKLAKAAKLNQAGETVETVHLNLIGDSSGKSDEGMHTIRSETNEMLDSKNTNQVQYPKLIQSAMMSDAKKLKVGKRRQSLSKFKEGGMKSEKDNRVGAKTMRGDNTKIGLLKKRIPKLSQSYATENNAKSKEWLKNSSPTSKSTYAASESLGTQSKPKEKRIKPSKWGDKVEIPTQQQTLNQGRIAASNMIVDISSRPSSIPHPPVPPPPISNPNLFLSHCWPLPTNSFLPIRPINPLICGNVPPPPAPPNVLISTRNSIDNPQSEMKREITIDGLQKEIRVYDNIAIVFMELDQPREIGFKPGQRKITIENTQFVLSFNDAYKPIKVGGDTYRIRFGFPSRELYIDDHWYEVCFGGPPVPIPLNQQLPLLQVEGPVPEVNIGSLRLDLVAGKISMIVNAKIEIPLYLDANIQTFYLDQNKHTLQFADRLQTIILNEEPFTVEYGGLPKSFTLNGNKYFIRFSSLPTGVVAGEVEIRDMRFVRISSSTDKPTPSNNLQTNKNVDAPNEVAGSEEIAQIAAQNETSSSAINMDLLLELVSTGVIKLSDSSSKETSQEAPNKILPIDLNNLDSMKAYQPEIANLLYLGRQCSSCGVRFPPKQTVKYDQHLDWHFRQNRKDRDISKKKPTRDWYYDFSDWLQFEEIEETEEREKNDIENEVDISDANSNHAVLSPAPTCPAGPFEVDRFCDVCDEKFEQFYSEEFEEWHLRSAIRVQEKIYHPICLEDLKKLNKKKTDSENSKMETEDSSPLKNNNENVNDLQAQNDDDDVVLLPNEEPLITEIVDDDDDEPKLVDQSTAETVSEGHIKSVDTKSNAKNDSTLSEANESDVEIQEPYIPFTDLDSYEEKDLSNSQQVFSKILGVKIKEEPKDEEEDDGFEEVGPCIPEEEITMNSVSGSTDGNCHFNLSENSIIRVEDAKSNAAPFIESSNDLSNPKSVNLETDEDNSSGMTGLPPTTPFASLVNKIKINITKNVAQTNSNILSTNRAGNVSIETNEFSVNNDTTENSNSSTPIVSSIPVLCAGGTMSTNFTVDSQYNNFINTNCHKVSTISVIGSYDSSVAPRKTDRPTQPVTTEQPKITFDLKPALKNLTLKNVPKKEYGMETSGLCSIM